MTDEKQHTPAEGIDLTTLSPAALADLAAKVERQQQAQRQRAIEELKATITKELSQAGLSTADLDWLFPKKKRTKSRSLAAKFRDPKSPTHTWSGHGRKPKWVEAHLAAGGTLDELRIKS